MTIDWNEILDYYPHYKNAPTLIEDMMWGKGMGSRGISRELTELPDVMVSRDTILRYCRLWGIKIRGRGGPNRMKKEGG